MSRHIILVGSVSKPSPSLRPFEEAEVVLKLLRVGHHHLLLALGCGHISLVILTETGNSEGCGHPYLAYQHSSLIWHVTVLVHL